MSTWYKTGTVSVTNGSGTVTGTGTAWVTALQIGDAIWLPDGRPYEVTGVISATSLTISPNYAGATARGQPYRVQPTRGVVQQLLSTVQTWLAGQQAYVDGPLAGKFGAGSAALPGVAFAGDVDTGMVNPAANQLGLATSGVIRALLSGSGLSLNVPLTGSAVTADASDATANRLMRVGAGGLLGVAIGVADLDLITNTQFIGAEGATLNRPPGASFWVGVHVQRAGGIAVQMMVSRADTPNPPLMAWRRQNGGVWSGWERGIGLNNLLGTVSQAGGVPTGAVIERGSNANGDYVRWADGTQICSGRVEEDSLVCTATSGGIWTTDTTRSFNFPASFAVTVPAVSLHMSRRSGAWDSHAVATSVNATTLQYFPAKFASGTYHGRLNWTAIGRWF